MIDDAVTKSTVNEGRIFGSSHAMRNEFYLISKESRGASLIAVMFQAEVA